MINLFLLFIKFVAPDAFSKYIIEWKLCYSKYLCQSTSRLKIPL